MNARVYLDYNATAPLCMAARDAMIGAMDLLGNPSSVHAEGRAARMIIETARGQLADFMGCDRADLVFTSSASEAAAMCFAPSSRVMGAPIEHDAIHTHLNDRQEIAVDYNGVYVTPLPDSPARIIALQSANSETGVCQNTLDIAQMIWGKPNNPLIVVDAVQAMGKRKLRIDQTGGDFVLCAPHKFGGPKGVGVLYVKSGVAFHALISGGGQEEGRRAGTENIIGIAGAGAAAVAAAQDLKNGVFEQITALRDWFEGELQAIAPDSVFPGQKAQRLPNTSCFAVRGWRGELQVMQMDLAGFAISAGSACSSGKIRQSRVLRAMGYDDEMAQSAIRVSIGAQTTKKHLSEFILAWTKAYHNFKAKAA